MAIKSKFPLVAFTASKFRNVGDFILNLKAIVLNIGAAVSYFPTPKPTLASVTTNIGDLETAETKAKTRAVGTVAARNLIYDTCYKDLLGLVAYVQVVANAATDAATAIAIIEAAGFNVRVNGVRVKAPIFAKNSTDEGVILLSAKGAGKNSVYQWQISSDGSAWTDLPLTQISKTEARGLTAGAKKYFRVRTINKPNGTSEWTAAVAIFVM